MGKRTALTVAVILGGTLAVLAVGSYAGAEGGKQNVKADLNGFLEVPSVSSTGTGSFEAEIDEDAGTISYTLTYSGLEGSSTLFAHIHLGQRSVNGGVSAFLCGGGGKPVCDPTSDSVSDTILPADVIGPTAQGIAAGEFAELVAAIRAGRAYANVHTNKHPGGEIRGQINDDNQQDD